MASPVVPVSRSTSQGQLHVLHAKSKHHANFIQKASCECPASTKSTYTNSCVLPLNPEPPRQSRPFRDRCNEIKCPLAEMSPWLKCPTPPPPPPPPLLTHTHTHTPTHTHTHTHTHNAETAISPEFLSNKVSTYFKGCTRIARIVEHQKLSEAAELVCDVVLSCSEACITRRDFDTYGLNAFSKAIIGPSEQQVMRADCNDQVSLGRVLSLVRSSFTIPCFVL